MKMNKTLLALAASASFGLSGQAFAAVTAAGETISNSVTLSYTINAVGQTPVVSADVDFLVDNKVDMSLALDGSLLEDAAIGGTATFKYTLENTGNFDQKYTLNLASLSTSTIITNPSLTGADVSTVDFGALTYQFSSTDPAVSITAIPEIDVLAQTNVAPAAINTATFWVSITMPTSGYDDNDIAGLVATAKAVTSAGADLPDHDDDDKNLDLNGTTYVVKAEGVTSGSVKWDAQVTIYSGITVGAPDFTDPLDETVKPKLALKVINDPICDSTLSYNDYSAGCPAGSPTDYLPKAIPGALIEFTYTAKNTGSIDAETVSFTETVDTQYEDDSLTARSADNDSTPVTPVLSVGGSGTTDTITADFGTVDTDNTFTIKYTAIVK